MLKYKVESVHAGVPEEYIIEVHCFGDIGSKMWKEHGITSSSIISVSKII